jgi:uncharacterized protein
MTPLLINLRHLERKSVVLEGELTAEDLELVALDDLIQLAGPVEYDLEAEQLDDGILVQGSLRAQFDCECGRCLKKFTWELELDGWACHLPLEGEEAVTVNNDSVDLTPFLREDILLELPQRPLCKPDCAGLPKAVVGKVNKNAQIGHAEAGSAAWAELNKLKF